MSRFKLDITAIGTREELLIHLGMLQAQIEDSTALAPDKGHNDSVFVEDSPMDYSFKPMKDEPNNTGISTGS